MTLHNNFKDNDLLWFSENRECWKCGLNHWNCFHHIVGRGNGDSKVESSILNACPLNNFECHLKVHGFLMTKESQKKLLQKTIRYLLGKGYILSELDKNFIIKYKEYYE